MKIGNYLDNLNDDDKNTFYYLLDEMGISDDEIKVVKEDVKNDFKKEMEFLNRVLTETDYHNEDEIGYVSKMIKELGAKIIYNNRREELKKIFQERKESLRKQWEKE